MAATALLTLSIAELAPKIRARDVSPVEFTEAALAQAERLQPTLDSFITILHDTARQQAREQEAALMRGEYGGPLQEVDVLVTPTAPVPAPPIGAQTVTLGGTAHRVRGPGSGVVSKNTSPSNATGLPAITVPCGFSAAGLPIGLQLIGRPFEEAQLFQVAHAYEAVSPARGRHPDIVKG